MFGDNRDFTFFLVVLITAIVVSLVFHIFFRQNVYASFSEIYFPNPDGLPNQVSLGQKYNFTFLIKNDEEKPATYEYNSKLELFNLYDVTEGIYKCVAQQRKKVLLTWEYSNETNKSVSLENNKITGFITYPQDKSTNTN